MKKQIPSLLILLLALAGVAVFQPGCASTPTKESTGEYIDDSTITTKVKAALVKDDSVRSHEISVETFKGIVQLSGFVATDAERARAEVVAASVTGVRSVTNSLQLK